MTTAELVHAPRSDLTLRSDQTFWDEKQLAGLRQLGLDNASNADLAVFFHQVVRTGLDPFARQIYMIWRDGKQTIQTGIDGFRLIARRAVDRTGETLGYEDTQWCGTDGKWVDVWLAQAAPAAARVVVLRNGQRYPAVALFSEYVARKRDGTITRMWQTKAALMLAKCAEALALRKAFPQDLSGIYTSDEVQSSAPSDTHWESDPQTGGGADNPDTEQAGVGSPPAAGEMQESTAPPSHPTDAYHDGVSPAQLKKIGALMTGRGMTDRGDALAYVANVIGRHINSRNELTKDEASAVIQALERDTVQETEPHPDEAPVGESKQQELA